METTNIARTPVSYPYRDHSLKNDKPIGTINNSLLAFGDNRFKVFEDGRVGRQKDGLLIGQLDREYWDKTGLKFNDLRVKKNPETGEPEGLKSKAQKSLLKNRDDLKQNIATGRDKTIRDTRSMPQLLEGHNDKYPTLNLHFAKSPKQMLRKALKDLPLAPGSKMRFLMESGSHTTAYEFKRHDGGGISVIGVDCLENGSHNDKVLSAMQKEKGINAFCMYYTETLKHRLGCVGFAMDAVKGLHSNPDGRTDSMHLMAMEVAQGKKIKQVDTGYGPRVQQVMGKDAFLFLPMAVGKNVQSKKRLQEIIGSRPGALEEPVNKRGENIVARLKRITSYDYQKDTGIPENVKQNPNTKRRAGIYNLAAALIGKALNRPGGAS